MLCSRPMRRFSSVLAGLGFAALVLAGCKQGEGERCQVDDDCESPLVCNTSTDTCQTSPGGPTVDAAIDAPLDAEIDGGADAAIDAALDASIDAAP